MMITLVFISVFELVKQLIFPDITMWQSHIITIILFSFIVTVAAFVIIRDNAWRKHNEELLHESERKYRAIFDQTFQFIGLIAIDGTLIEANRAALEFVRAKEQDVIGKPFWETPWWTHSSETQEKLRSNVEKAARGEFVRFESTHRAADGGLHYFDCSLKPVTDEYGKVVLIIPEGREITERKNAEDELRQSKENFRVFMDTSPAAVFIYQGDYIIEVNKAAERVTGYTKNELLKMEFWSTMHPDYQELVRERGRARLRGEAVPSQYEARLVIKNGDARWIEVTAGRIEYKGKPAVIVSFFDVTERKHTEEKLRRTNRSLKALSRCNDTVVHAKDETALLQDICQIIVEVGGYRMAWIGYAEKDEKKAVRPVAHMGYEDGYLDTINITWEDTERGRGPTGMAIRTGKPCIVRFTLTDTAFIPWRDEALQRGYASVLGLPLAFSGLIFGALTIYSDKTDAFDEEEVALLKELADDLAYGITALRDRVRRNLVEKELEDAKNQSEIYLDLMGHDINNLNQVGIGFLELALNTLDLDEEARKLISKPLESLESSSRLIENVRKLQRLKDGSLRFHMMDVGHVIRDLIPKYSHVPGRDVSINYTSDCACQVMANELINDVFSNIMGNAIKHSSGQLTINVHLSKDIMNSKKYCKVTIEDDGPGIPDELKKRLFLRFQRGHTKAGGKGLGLFLIKMLINDYDGKIWVEDRVPGDHPRGCRFVVMLPAIEK